MSSAGENMPELERQRWLDKVALNGYALTNGTIIALSRPRYIGIWTK
jgi:DUF1365 family protein